MIAKNNSSASSTLPDFSRSPTIDQVGVEERVERFQKRSIKKESKVKALKLALSMIDLTTLEGADSPGKVQQMCYKAAHLADNVPDVPHVAAVCVYPTLVKIAKDALKGTGIKVAAVATGFPSGQSGDAGSDPRFLLRDGKKNRHETRGWNLGRQDGDSISRDSS